MLFSSGPVEHLPDTFAPSPSAALPREKTSKLHHKPSTVHAPKKPLLSLLKHETIELLVKKRTGSKIPPSSSYLRRHPRGSPEVPRNRRGEYLLPAAGLCRSCGPAQKPPPRNYLLRPNFDNLGKYPQSRSSNQGYALPIGVELLVGPARRATTNTKKKAFVSAHSPESRRKEEAHHPLPYLPHPKHSALPDQLRTRRVALHAGNRYDFLSSCVKEKSVLPFRWKPKPEMEVHQHKTRQIQGL